MVDIRKIPQQQVTNEDPAYLERLGDTLEEVAKACDEKKISDTELKFVYHIGGSYYFDTDMAGLEAILGSNGATQSAARKFNETGSGALQASGALDPATTQLLLQKQVLIDSITGLETSVALLKLQQQELPNDLEIAKTEVQDLEEGFKSKNSPSLDLLISAVTGIVSFGICAPGALTAGKKLMLLNQTTKDIYFLFARESKLREMCGGKIPTSLSDRQTPGRLALQKFGLPALGTAAVGGLLTFGMQILGSSDPAEVTKELAVDAEENTDGSATAGDPEPELFNLSLDDLTKRVEELLREKRRVMLSMTKDQAQLVEYNRIKALKSRELLQKVDVDTIQDPALKALVVRMKSDTGGTASIDDILGSPLGSAISHGAEIGFTFGIGTHVVERMLSSRGSPVTRYSFDELDAQAAEQAKIMLAQGNAIAECKANEEGARATAKSKATVSEGLLLPDADAEKSARQALQPDFATGGATAYAGVLPVPQLTLTPPEFSFSAFTNRPAPAYALAGGAPTSRGDVAPLEFRVYNLQRTSAVTTADLYPRATGGRGSVVPKLAGANVSGVAGVADFVPGALLYGGLGVAGAFAMDQLNVPQDYQDAAGLTYGGYGIYSLARSPLLLAAVPAGIGGGDLTGTVVADQLRDANLSDSTKDVIVGGSSVVGGTLTAGGALALGSVLEVGLMGTGLIGIAVLATCEIGKALYEGYCHSRDLRQAKENFLSFAWDTSGKVSALDRKAIDQYFESCCDYFGKTLNADFNAQSLADLRRLLSSPNYKMLSQNMGWWFDEVYFKPFEGRFDNPPFLEDSPQVTRGRDYAAIGEKYGNDLHALFLDMKYPGLAQVAATFEKHLTTHMTAEDMRALENSLNLDSLDALFDTPYTSDYLISTYIDPWMETVDAYDDGGVTEWAKDQFRSATTSSEDLVRFAALKKNFWLRVSLLTDRIQHPYADDIPLTHFNDPFDLSKQVQLPPIPPRSASVSTIPSVTQATSVLKSAPTAEEIKDGNRIYDSWIASYTSWSGAFSADMWGSGEHSSLASLIARSEKDYSFGEFVQILKRWTRDVSDHVRNRTSLQGSTLGTIGAATFWGGDIDDTEKSRLWMEIVQLEDAISEYEKSGDAVLLGSYSILAQEDEHTIFSYMSVIDTILRDSTSW